MTKRSLAMMLVCICTLALIYIYLRMHSETAAERTERAVRQVEDAIDKENARRNLPPGH